MTLVMIKVRNRMGIKLSENLGNKVSNKLTGRFTKNKLFNLGDLTPFEARNPPCRTAEHDQVTLVSLQNS
jgi:hypothetical protein